MTETIPGMLREAALRYGDKAALVPPDGAPMSFVELDQLTDCVTRALIRGGLKSGDRLGIWLPNMFEWVAAAVGTQRIGGVIIPLYFRYQAAEVLDILQRTGAAYLICTAELAEGIRGAAPASLRSVIVVNAAGRQLTGCEIGWVDFLAGGAEVAEEDLQAREASVIPDSTSDIMFTSGTTGRPKGAVFTHRSAVAAARIMQHYNQATPQDCFCPMGSFAHVGGYKQGWLTGLTSGAAIAWGDAFDAASVLDLIARLRISIMPAAPITWQGVLDFPGRSEIDISTLRFVATGGTMIPRELIERLTSEMNVAQVGSGYGMTETCGMDAYSLPEDSVEKVISTVGRPALDTRIRIVGLNGQELGPGQPGEILISNPRLLKEYLDDPEATDAALSDGWFRSGDIGTLDDEGYLAITDRLKDMYIINGLNVYPAEIERSLEQLGGVQQCAVVARPEAVKGEVGAAFIVRAPGSSLSEEEVIAWCRAHLANYKVPKHVAFVDTLPRNAMGKVLKNELRAELEKLLEA